MGRSKQCKRNEVQQLSYCVEGGVEFIFEALSPSDPVEISEGLIRRPFCIIIYLSRKAIPGYLSKLGLLKVFF